MCLSSFDTVDETVADRVLRVDNLPKALDGYKNLATVMGRFSLLTVENDEDWYRLRKLFNPAFSQSHLEIVTPGIVEEAKVFVKTLNQAAMSSEPIRLLDFCTV